MTDPILRKTLYLNAAQDAVWAYLTEPDKLAQWFHRPEQTLTEGTELALYGAESGDKLVWGEVTVARPPEYLEYTFTIKPMGEIVSLVKWTLEPVNGGTRLSLEHSGLSQDAEMFGLVLALDKGWDDHLARMREGLHTA